jgi:hypothetical protein
MLEINKGIICNIIYKAREINIAEDLVLPEDEDNLSELEWKQILAEYQNDLSYLELKNLINDLEPDQQKKVIALMYLGRGDFDRSEWQLALNQAVTVPVSNRADYLISKNMLADYLREGLAIFNYSCDEEDR